MGFNINDLTSAAGRSRHLGILGFAPTGFPAVAFSDKVLRQQSAAELSRSSLTAHN
jgi:hypothetical protein